MEHHLRKSYPELGITVDVSYRGIHPLGKMRHWETQILGVENSPKGFFKPVDETMMTCDQVANYIASWYENPSGRKK